jgi:hypothetical protein
LTTVSLVFPLTNVGAGLMRGEAPQANNGNPSDHASVLEGLTDLRDSAVFLDEFPSGLPEEAIIIEWQDKEPSNFLVPKVWDITVLLGTSYTTPDPSGEYFVWTDIWPNVLRGDVTGDGDVDQQDRGAIDQYIVEHDALDGQVDGRVEILDFAVDFSVFDVNHGGVVDSLDVALATFPGDQDADGDADLADAARFQGCLSGSGVSYAPWECGLSDFDGDGDVDLEDWGRFSEAMTGPVEED